MLARRLGGYLLQPDFLRMLTVGIYLGGHCILCEHLREPFHAKLVFLVVVARTVTHKNGPHRFSKLANFDNTFNGLEAAVDVPVVQYQTPMVVILQV